MIGFSRVGLGTNNFGRRLDLAGTRAVVDAALEAGVTHFDTANIYGDGDSERFLGELLQGRRERVVLATKFGHSGDREKQGLPGGSPEYVPRAIDSSLARLRTDRVDVLYYHEPDGVTPVGETLTAMLDVVRAGKARALGVSNLDAAQLREAHAAAGDALVVLQNQYSLLRREAEADVLPLCVELGVGFVPYFPLASGLLTGKYRRGEPPPPGTRLAGRPGALTDEAFDVVERLERFAEERGRTLLEVAIAGLASRPGVVSVIAGATTAEQVRANAAAGEWRLDETELEELSRAASG